MSELDTTIHRADALHVRAIRDSSREADFVASTDTVDRYDEVIDQSTWDLRSYLALPIVLYGHNSYSKLPIGQCSKVGVVNNQLECTIKFASAEANPEAEQVWRLVQEKVLRAVSVGFKPKNGRFELRDGKEIFVLSDCELREISVVAMPANPDCLAKMKSKALADKLSATPEGAPAPAGATTTEGAVSVVVRESNVMDEKQMKDAVEKAQTDVATANVAVTTAKAEAKAASEKAAALETERDTLKAEKAALDLAHAKSTETLATLTAEKALVDGKVIELEVSALVGTKLTPAEKASFVKLAKADRVLFDEMIADKKDLGLLGQVIPEKIDVKAAPGAGGMDDIAAEVRNLANA